MKISLPELFYEFLENNNLLEIYLDEVNKRLNELIKEDDVDYYMILDLFTNKNSDTNLREFTSNSFIWADSHNGFDFWSDVNAKWHKLLRSLKID